MKKFKILIPTLAIAILLTGCFKSPLTILKDASEKMKELENYHMTMKVDMEMNYDGTSISISMNAESDIDEKNGIGVMDTTASFFGMSSTERTYMTYKDGKQVTYSKVDEEWYKEESEYEETVDFDMFSDVSSIEKVKDEENTYKITLTEEQIKELMNNMEDTEGAEIDLNSVEVKVTVTDGYITKIVMTMPMSTTEEGVTMTMDATMSFEFSKFNEVTNVSIPKEVINNAKDMTLYNIQMDVENYIDEIAWDIYDNEYVGATYTNTELEYDGAKPSKVEVTIRDGFVANGYIEISGYKANIVGGVVDSITKLN